jgi:alpha-tubulin suppressor-like RCC1 family protein
LIQFYLVSRLQKKRSIRNVARNLFQNVCRASEFMRISCLLLMMFIGVKTYSQTIICAGGQHTLAIKIDSTLWGWGANTSGQLGFVLYL